MDRAYLITKLALLKMDLRKSRKLMNDPKASNAAYETDRDYCVYLETEIDRIKKELDHDY